MTDEKIQTIYGWYVDALKRNGAHPNVPKKTDLKKTYVWRAITKFANKTAGWGISDELSKKLIYEVVTFSMKRKNKSALLMSDAVLKKCLNFMIDRMKAQEEAMERLRKSKRFLDKNEKLLLMKERDGGWPNIVVWHRSGDLSLSCLALSRRCGHIMKQMSEIDRRNLPDLDRINKIRIKYLINDEMSECCRKTLGSDLVTPRWGKQ